MMLAYLSSSSFLQIEDSRRRNLFMEEKGRYLDSSANGSGSG
jgi:hypothetical protein